MKPARQIGGWISERLPNPFAKQTLYTSDSVRNELFGSLDLYSEVRDFGRQILKANGHSNPKASFPKLQAYLRQAKTFYVAAEHLHYRASPLNYYYSFMNFAKAYSLLRDPTFADDKLHHGLSPHQSSGALRRHAVQVKSNGVFPIFCNHLIGSYFIGGDRLNIASLLGYVADVRFEYSQLKFGPARSFPCRFAIATNSQRTQSHGLVAVSALGSSQFKSVVKSLAASFDEVDIQSEIASEIFDIRAEVKQAFRFFESKKVYALDTNGRIPTGQIVHDVVSTLRKVLSYNPQNDNFLFRLNSPVTTPKPRPMNEIVAIYCCMFHLGSLVRYRPAVLESMLAKKDSWMIERFVTCAPITLLRHMRNLMDGRYLVYVVR